MTDHADRTDLDDDSEAAFWRNLRNEAGNDRANYGGRNDWFKSEREQANRVACVDCGAPIGVDCHRDLWPIETLRKFPAHPRRVNAAKALFG
jgi:hypothetical protein